ncbi:MAG: cytochrome c [Alphaproteobacteria bacterium]|nr:MAG: cytochrome c [Alphaproteobacteria bacterium]
MLKKLNWMTAVNAVILLFAAALILAMVQSLMGDGGQKTDEQGLPFYTTADPELERAGSDLYRSLQCRNCHTIWSVKSVFQSVPAPSLDGIGSLRSEEWLYRYFSAENPQQILPSRLKAKYRMPSYAHLSEAERRTLARYFASLKVRDWYLDEVRKAERRKLTGRED